MDEVALEMRHNRRMKREARYEENLLRREAAAEKLVGEMMVDGKTVYYINIQSKSGKRTGKIKTFQKEYDAIRYLMRNAYV